MFSEQLKNLIFRVVSSWQVIAVSISLILYFLLVSYVGRTYHRPRIAPIIPKIKKPKKTDEAEVTADDDLGIEEAE
ncbi:MAG: hypothetical protein LBP76_11035 [Treponema sp.]|nr:hypothetical protein [Treponema sp.]